jgi:hypothetical protein
MNQSIILALAVLAGAWIAIFLIVTLPYLMGVIFHDSAKLNGHDSKSSNLRS